MLRQGLDAFATRMALIDKYERAIDAQYYIFRDDITSKYLMYCMLAAADRGPRVRLLLDDLRTSGIDDILAAANVHPNMEVRLFNPGARGPWTWFARTTDFLWRPLRINRRMHNKVLAGDRVAAIIGGGNVADEYFDASQGVNFGDLDLLALGPVVREAGQSFDLYWSSSLMERLDGWSSFDRKPEDLEDLQASLEQDAEDAAESKYAQRLQTSSFMQEAGE